MRTSNTVMPAGHTYQQGRRKALLARSAMAVGYGPRYVPVSAGVVTHRLAHTPANRVPQAGNRDFAAGLLLVLLQLLLLALAAMVPVP